jgi:hypothetical protein
MIFNFTEYTEKQVIVDVSEVNKVLNEISRLNREVDEYKALIANSIWTIECMVEDYDDNDQDTALFLKKLRVSIH